MRQRPTFQRQHRRRTGKSSIREAAASSARLGLCLAKASGDDIRSVRCGEHRRKCNIFWPPESRSHRSDAVFPERTFQPTKPNRPLGLRELESGRSGTVPYHCRSCSLHSARDGSSKVWDVDHSASGRYKSCKVGQCSQMCPLDTIRDHGRDSRSNITFCIFCCSSFLYFFMWVYA